MGQPKPLDENLPEVVPAVPNQPHSTLEPVVHHVFDSTPQALSEQELAEKGLESHERDKYPAIYDNAPMLPHEVSPTGQAWVAGDPPSALTQTTRSSPWEQLPAGGDAETSDPRDQPPAEDPKRICGMSRRNFVIAAIAAILVIIAAAVGGGVGASRSSGSSPSPVTTPMPTPIPIPLPTPTPTSTPDAQKFLNNGTAPRGLAFQGFTGLNYTGNATNVIQDEGFHDLNIEARSYVWLQDDTNCCLTFCKGLKNDTGWWCNTRFRTNATAEFDRIYIWCGGNDGIKNTTCS